MMTAEELQALEWVVNYVLGSEKAHYDEWVAEGHIGNRHIYHYAEKLSDYIKGLHSTGSYPNGV